MVALLLVLHLLEMVEKCFEMAMVEVVLVIVEKVRKVVVIVGEMR